MNSRSTRARLTCGATTEPLYKPFDAFNDLGDPLRGDPLRHARGRDAREWRPGRLRGVEAGLESGWGVATGRAWEKREGPLSPPRSAQLLLGILFGYGRSLARLILYSIDRLAN